MTIFLWLYLWGRYKRRFCSTEQPRACLGHDADGRSDDRIAIEAQGHMKRPPHPGGIIRRQCLEPLGLSVTEAAKGLGVTRQALSDLVNENADVSVDMAIRLTKAFGSSAETWLQLQMAYDLWHAQKHADKFKVKRFKAA